MSNGERIYPLIDTTTGSVVGWEYRGRKYSHEGFFRSVIAPWIDTGDPRAERILSRPEFESFRTPAEEYRQRRIVQLSQRRSQIESILRKRAGDIAGVAPFEEILRSLPTSDAEVAALIDQWNAVRDRIARIHSRAQPAPSLAQQAAEAREKRVRGQTVVPPAPTPARPRPKQTPPTRRLRAWEPDSD